MSGPMSAERLAQITLHAENDAGAVELHANEYVPELLDEVTHLQTRVAALEAERVETLLRIEQAEVERDHARVNVVRLQAERAALLAPVEGVDLEALVEKARIWHDAVTRAVQADAAERAQYGFTLDEELDPDAGLDRWGAVLALQPHPYREIQPLVAALLHARARIRDLEAPGECQSLHKLRADLEEERAAHRETQARLDALHNGEPDPLLIAASKEIARLEAERDAYRKAKAENDERFQIEAGEARAEVEELRLTLAAEQGRPEGAPSEGWTYDHLNRRWSRRHDRYTLLESHENGSWEVWRTEAARPESSPFSYDREVARGRAFNHRARMLAADKAVSEKG